ncbi:hypothetical protein [Kribbella sp. NPDC049584]|uniref:hypothetical protein n=1 Tax=Kribbella sp. NPDC049584 TaxID=3154833 RepID=UPI003430D236
MTNHALTTEATCSGGVPGGSKVIADGNGDQERPARADEPATQLSDVRSLGGIPR